MILNFDEQNLPKNSIPISDGAFWRSKVLTPTGGNILTITDTEIQIGQPPDAPSGRPAVQLFTTSGTYEIPAWASFLRIIAIGGGGGGGSGARTASGSAIGGGGGGAGGNVSDLTYNVPDAISLNGGTSVSIAIGAGLQGTGSDHGYRRWSQGGSGIATAFGALLHAGGGAQGTGGSTSTPGTGGASLPSGMFLGAAGTNGGTTASVAANTNAPNLGGGGGGGGSGIDSGGVGYAGERAVHHAVASPMAIPRPTVEPGASPVVAE